MRWKLLKACSLPLFPSHWYHPLCSRLTERRTNIEPPSPRDPGSCVVLPCLCLVQINVHPSDSVTWHVRVTVSPGNRSGHGGSAVRRAPGLDCAAETEFPENQTRFSWCKAKLCCIALICSYKELFDPFLKVIIGFSSLYTLLTVHTSKDSHELYLHKAFI